MSINEVIKYMQEPWYAPSFQKAKVSTVNANPHPKRSQIASLYHRRAHIVNAGVALDITYHEESPVRGKCQFCYFRQIADLLQRLEIAFPANSPQLVSRLGIQYS